MYTEREQEILKRVSNNKVTPKVLKFMWLLYGLNKPKALDLLVRRISEQWYHRTKINLEMDFTFWFCWKEAEEGDSYWRHIEHLHRMDEGMQPLNEPV